MGGLGPGERSRVLDLRFTSSLAAGVGIAVTASAPAVTVPVATSTSGRLWHVSDIFREPM